MFHWNTAASPIMCLKTWAQYLVYFCSRAFQKRKEKSKSTSKDNHDQKNSISLEKLTQKLDKNLAEEVQNCWIDPQKIILDKFLGHGKQSSSTMRYGNKPLRISTPFLLIPGNFAVVWSGSLQFKRHMKIAVAVKKRKGKCWHSKTVSLCSEIVILSL